MVTVEYLALNSDENFYSDIVEYENVKDALDADNFLKTNFNNTYKNDIMYLSWR